MALRPGEGEARAVEAEERLPVYACPHRPMDFRAYDSRLRQEGSGDPAAAGVPVVDWPSVPEVWLTDTVTGKPPLEPTSMQACWHERGFLMRFSCADSWVLSDFTQRDEPLYEQDVVELFLDEAGDGRRYLELEVSPRGVLFDAVIHNDGSGRPDGVQADLAWDPPGIGVQVSKLSDSHFTYELFLPAAEFAEPLRSGREWRVNAYRIDHRPGSEPELQAWSPTGHPWFHVPRRFGVFRLVV